MSLKSIRIQIFPGCEFYIAGLLQDATICNLKQKIAKIKHYSVEQMVLSLGLENEEYLAEYQKLRELEPLGPGNLTLRLTLFNRKIQLRFVRPEHPQNDLIIKTYPCTLISTLKIVIQEHLNIPTQDQTLSYNGMVLGDTKLLIDYNIKDAEDTNISIEDINATTTSRPIEISLFVRKPHQHVRGKLSLGMDFSFNTIKNVRKVGWKDEAPSYREVTDGLAWFCYCRNAKCSASNELFIANRGTIYIHQYIYQYIYIGFGHFYLSKEIKQISCPNCSRSCFDLRNMGFVNCQWQYRGILINKTNSRISGEGKTYDNKLYTFKEADYKTMWENFELLVKHLDKKFTLRNITEGEEEEANVVDTGNQEIPPISLNEMKMSILFIYILIYLSRRISNDAKSTKRQ